MKNPKSLLAMLLMLVAVAAMLSASMVRADDKDASKDKDDDDDPKTRRVVFKPPTAGAPAARTGGASRSPAAPRLWGYSPLETGLTVSAKPKFYWYQDQPTTDKLVFTILEHTPPGKPKKEMLVNVEIDSPTVGVHCFDLATQPQELAVGVEYVWSVRAKFDAKSPSLDPFSSGWIKRIPLSDDLKRQLDAASTQDKPGVLSANGIWYDSLMATDDLIATDPTAQWLRISLLKQVQLKEAAAYEKSQVKAASAK